MKVKGNRFVIEVYVDKEEVAKLQRLQTKLTEIKGRHIGYSEYFRGKLQEDSNE